MSLDLQKQNKMLKQYVEVLERENSSRNKEKDILMAGLDSLTQENEELRAQLARVGNQSRQQPQPQVQVQQVQQNNKEVEMLVKVRKELEGKVGEMQGKLDLATKAKNQVDIENARLRAEVQNANNRLVAAQSMTNVRSVGQAELSRLKTQNQELRKQNSTISQKDRELIDLQNKNKQLRLLLTQSEQKIKSVQQQSQLKSTQFRQTETQTIRNTIRREFQAQKQRQILQLNQNHTTIIQNKDRTIGELEQKVRELERKVQSGTQVESIQVNRLRMTQRELEGKIGIFERERTEMQRKISELKRDIDHKGMALNKRQEQMGQLQRIRLSVSLKEQQLEKSDIIIKTLKDNIANLEQRLQHLQFQLDQSSNQSRQQIYTNENRQKQEFKNIQQGYQREIQELREELDKRQRALPQMFSEQMRVVAEKVRENEELKKIIAELSENNNHLLERIKQTHEKEEINQSAQVKEPAKYTFREQVNNNNISNINTNTNTNQAELRNVVQELRRQLRSVKSDFKRIEQDNKKMEQLISSKAVDTSVRLGQRVSPQYPTPDINRSMNYRQKRTPYPQLSPNHSHNALSSHELPEQSSNIKHSKLRNQSEKFRVVSALYQENPKSMNRDKWEMLQRRITQLREENAELKQSLYS